MARLNIAFVAVLMLAVGVMQTEAVDCPTTDDCLTCIAVAGCGFCADRLETVRCKEGDESGPDGLGATCDNWRFDASLVGNAVPGFPISPSAVDAYLVEGDAVSVNVVFTVPLTDTLPLDLMFLQDASESMSDNIEDLRDSIPTLFNAILEFQYDTRFGFGSFIDHPTNAGGGPSGGWSDDIHLYRRASPLTNNFNQVQQAIIQTPLAGNWDNPETSLDALLFATVCPAEDDWGSGWRDGGRKVAVIITDAPFKCEETSICDNECCDSGCFDTPADADPRHPNLIGGVARNNYDCVADRSGGAPAEYYPAVSEMRSLLQEYDIIPLFISPESTVCDKSFSNTLGNQYRSLVSSLGRGGWEQLVDNGEQLSNSIIGFLRSLGGEAALEVVPGTYSDFVRSISGGDTNVSPGDSVPFSFVLRRDGGDPAVSGADPTIVLQVPGFGDDARLTVHLKDYLFSCDNCSPAPAGAGPFVFDECGVCGGDDSTCTGCDGEIYPPPASVPVADQCMTCPGNGNAECTGCDGEIYPPRPDTVDETDPRLKFPDIQLVDDCGVCGGDGLSCKGCDGVADSGLVYDRCGVCDGDGQSCLGCDGLPPAPGEDAPKVYDICGICGGDDSTCTGCDGVKDSGWIFDACNVCRAPDDDTPPDCLGCDNIPFSGKVEDACGICGGDKEEGDSCDESGPDPAVVIGASVAGAVAGVAAAVGLFVLYKYKTRGAAWYYQDAFESSTTATSNPLYESNKKEHHNPLFDKA